MRVDYDAQQPIGGIGLTPWMRLGPERWFPAYTIFAQETMPGVPAKVILPGGICASTKAMLANPQVAKAVLKALPPGPLLVSRPAGLPHILNGAGYKLYALNSELTHTLENKAEFRLALKGCVPFPGFAIYGRHELNPGADDFKRIARGRQAFVMQDELSTGGRGTHIVRDLASYREALASLLYTGPRVVVSDFIEGRERTLQCCVTQYGTVVGPMQKQVVGDPQLTNMHVVQGDRFCGGEIDPHDPCSAAYPTMRRVAETIGEALHSHGYRGIFGLDFIVSPEGKVFLLELNPRFTGMTPLLTHAWRDERDIPFYLLHILELCHLPYAIAKSEPQSAPPCAQLILYSHAAAPVRLGALQSGIYEWQPTTGSLRFVRPGYRLADIRSRHEFLLEKRQLNSHAYRPGSRVAKLFFNRTILDSLDRPAPQTRRLAEAVYAHISALSTTV